MDFLADGLALFAIARLISGWHFAAMKIVTTGAELRETLVEFAGLAGRRVLVPTMGALHHGHMELVRRAREAAGPDGTVIVSIFVNPIQFDRASDLDAYPRPLESDLEKCLAAGVDVVFAPEATMKPTRPEIAPERNIVRIMTWPTFMPA